MRDDREEVKREGSKEIQSATASFVEEVELRSFARERRGLRMTNFLIVTLDGATWWLG